MRTSHAWLAALPLLSAALYAAPTPSNASYEAALSDFGYSDLVQAELAFGNRAPDMPPGACLEMRDSTTAEECRQRRIVRMHVQDINGDGWDDVKVLRADGSVTAYINFSGIFEESAVDHAWPHEELSRIGESYATSSSAADLNGDGWLEVVTGQGGDISGSDSALRHQVTLPPVIVSSRTGERLHILDLERRLIIGFAELVYLGDLTGDLAPDLLIAGQGMLHPHLYVNTAPAARFAAIESDSNLTLTLPDGRDHELEFIRTEGPVTWEVKGRSVGLGGEAGVKVRVAGAGNLELYPGMMASSSPRSGNRASVVAIALAGAAGLVYALVVRRRGSSLPH